MKKYKLSEILATSQDIVLENWSNYNAANLKGNGEFRSKTSSYLQELKVFKEALEVINSMKPKRCRKAKEQL